MRNGLFIPRRQANRAILNNAIKGSGCCGGNMNRTRSTPRERMAAREAAEEPIMDPMSTATGSAPEPTPDPTPDPTQETTETYIDENGQLQQAGAVSPTMKYALYAGAAYAAWMFLK
jgi:hypothetical protein